MCLAIFSRRETALQQGINLKEALSRPSIPRELM
jgi:hypothetical protein